MTAIEIRRMSDPSGTVWHPETDAQAIVGLAAAILAGLKVTSVNTKTGDVVLTATDVGAATPEDITAAIAALTKASVGLDQVDNTSDANKPMSVLQQAALDQLQQAIPTKLSQLEDDIGAGDNSDIDGGVWDAT